MRILLFILLLMIGGGMIAYSYIGAFIALAGELEQTQTAYEATSLMMTALDRIATGDMPRLTGFLYGGALVIVVAIIHLFMKRETNDR